MLLLQVSLPTVAKIPICDDVPLILALVGNQTVFRAANGFEAIVSVLDGETRATTAKEQACAALRYLTLSNSNSITLYLLGRSLNTPTTGANQAYVLSIKGIKPIITAIESIAKDKTTPAVAIAEHALAALGNVASSSRIS